MSHVMQTVRKDNHNAALALSLMDWFVLHFWSALNRKRPDIHLGHLSAMVAPGIKTSLVMYDKICNSSQKVEAGSLHWW